MMAYLKAAIITALVIAGFLAVSALIAVIFPVLIIAAVFYAVLVIIKFKPPS